MLPNFLPSRDEIKVAWAFFTIDAAQAGEQAHSRKGKACQSYVPRDNQCVCVRVRIIQMLPFSFNHIDASLLLCCYWFEHCYLLVHNTRTRKPENRQTEKEREWRMVLTLLRSDLFVCIPTVSTISFTSVTLAASSKPKSCDFSSLFLSLFIFFMNSLIFRTNCFYLFVITSYLRLFDAFHIFRSYFRGLRLSSDTGGIRGDTTYTLIKTASFLDVELLKWRRFD